MNILFWNINKKNLTEVLPVLSEEYNIDILILAENNISDAEMLIALNKNNSRKFLLPPNFSNKLDIYSKFNPESIVPISDDGGISIKLIKPPIAADVIIVAVHFPSKLYSNDADYYSLSIRLSQEIEKAEEKMGHDRTIVIGDFNMNPFEDGLVAADGLHAVMDRSIAMKEYRIAQGVKKKFFYNPMWSLIGDLSEGPPGTYHYSKSGQVCFYWNTFDQVLIRPSLLNFFYNNSIKVITQINDTNLINNAGKPNNKEFSDHLPIFVCLKTEEI